MQPKDLSTEFGVKSFLMFLPPKGKNPLSVNGRLVVSYLFYRRKFNKGSSLKKLAEYLGMSAHHGVKSAIDELRNARLVTLGKNQQWYAPEDRPSIFASKGFIPVYMLRRSKGGRLTNTDNVMLWVLRYLQQPKVGWRWPRHRSAVLANFVGIEPRNVKRHITKLQRMNLVTADWRVNTLAIDPDWYRSPHDDGAVESYTPSPRTGNRFADHVLNDLDVRAGNRGMERPDCVQLLRSVICSGALARIENGRYLHKIGDNIDRCKVLDLPSVTAAIDAAFPEPRVVPEALSPAAPSDLDSLDPDSGDPRREPDAQVPLTETRLAWEDGDEPSGDGFGRLDLDALSLFGSQDGEPDDFDFLSEAITEDMVA